MPNYPDTVKYADAFERSQWHIDCPYCGKIIGFDGIFDWRWVTESIKKVNPKTNITPMDFDGVVERHSNYLIFETKDVGVDISKGQLITLKNLQKPKTFTVMKIWGKENPEKMEINSHDGVVKTTCDLGEMKNYVSRWYSWANNF